MPTVVRWPSKGVVFSRLEKSDFLNYLLSLYQERYPKLFFEYTSQNDWNRGVFYLNSVEGKNKKKQFTECAAVGCYTTGTLSLRVPESMSAGDLEKRLVELFEDFPDLRIETIVAVYDHLE